MKNSANPIPGSKSNTKKPSQKLEEKNPLEVAQNAEGAFQPHNAKKEALGPNTKR